MLFTDKCFTNESFQANKLICCVAFFLKPLWSGVISLSFSKYQTSLVFIIRSITLHKQLVKEIGR